MSDTAVTVQSVLSRVRAAAVKSGRDSESVKVVGVTKGIGLDKIREVFDGGIHLLGENRIQEAAIKVSGIPAEWHMIGHLQSNKVRDAVSLFSLIQSVDSVRLAQKIAEVSVELQKKTPILLEVNISSEEQKYGFRPSDIYGALDEMAGFEGIEIQGLMGIAPNSEDMAVRRESFRNLKSLYGVCRAMKSERFSWKYLSMGMSDDFEVAIEEGSNMVRLGRVLFGTRA